MAARAALILSVVTLASAMRAYVNRFAAAPGKRVAIFTDNDDGWKSAADLARAGVAVAAVIDSRNDAKPPAQIPGDTRTILGGEVLEGDRHDRLDGRRADVHDLA